MKPLEGCTVIELTEDRIVQEFHFGEKGRIRLIGNPNPPPEEHQKMIDSVERILLREYQRSLREKKVGA